MGCVVIYRVTNEPLLIIVVMVSMSCKLLLVLYCAPIKGIDWQRGWCGCLSLLFLFLGFLASGFSLVAHGLPGIVVWRLGGGFKGLRLEQKTWSMC